MPIDPSIALGYRGFTPPNPLNQLAQVSQIQSAQQANQLNQMKIAEAQRAVEQENALREATKGIDYSTPEGQQAYAQAMLKVGNIKGYHELQSAIAAQSEAERKARTAQLTNAAAKSKMYNDQLTNITDPQGVIAWYTQQAADPDMQGSPVFGMKPEDIQKEVLTNSVKKQKDGSFVYDPDAFNSYKQKLQLGLEKHLDVLDKQEQRTETKRAHLADEALARAREERLSQSGVNAASYPLVAQAIADGSLSPDRVNSRNAPILENAARVAQERGQSLDFNQLAGQGALARNPAFQQKAMAVESIPDVIKSVADAGKKLNFSDDLKAVADIQKWYAGQTQDPKLTEYMTLRNDSLMSIAYAMRQAGMSDYATRMEAEAASPSMSPKQLDAWVSAQMKALEPRLKQYRSVSVTGSKTSTPPAAGTVQTQKLEDPLGIRKSKAK